MSSSNWRKIQYNNTNTTTNSNNSSNINNNTTSNNSNNHNISYYHNSSNMFATPMYNTQYSTPMFDHNTFAVPPPPPPHHAPPPPPQYHQQQPPAPQLPFQLDTQNLNDFYLFDHSQSQNNITTTTSAADAALLAATTTYLDSTPISATSSTSYYLTNTTTDPNPVYYNQQQQPDGLFQPTTQQQFQHQHNPLLDNHSSPESDQGGNISSPQSIASTPNLTTFSAPPPQQPNINIPQQLNSDYMTQFTGYAQHSSSTPPSTTSNSSSSVGGQKRKYTCKICGKQFMRDLPRHMRTHEEVARFSCPYPRSYCPHKRGQFNRPYDFKKHLLHGHFIFDDKSAKSYKDLKSKLSSHGTCSSCGVRYKADDWINDHILGSDHAIKCPLLKH